LNQAKISINARLNIRAILQAAETTRLLQYILLADSVRANEINLGVYHSSRLMFWPDKIIFRTGGTAIRDLASNAGLPAATLGNNKHLAVEQLESKK